KESVTYAIVKRDVGQLCGAMGLELKLQHKRAEIGYWIGPEYWGNGYCTEAGLAVLEDGIEALGLHRTYAGQCATNPASGRVMRKLRMTYEGVLRDQFTKWDHFEDAVMYGILRQDWEGRAA